MAVEIDLDLDAGDAMGKLFLLRGQLSQLENQVDSIGDLEFDADIGDIASEIQNLVNSLEEVEVRVSSLSDEIAEAAAELDGAEVNVNASTPSGDTGAGDSTGSDPPINVRLGSIAEDAVGDGGDDGPSLNMRQLRSRMNDLFDADIQGMIDDNTLNWMSQGFEPYARNRDIHLGDDDRREGFRERAFGDFGFGTEFLTGAQTRRSMLTDSELSDVRQQSAGVPDYLKSFRDNEGLESFTDLFERFKNAKWEDRDFKGIDRLKDSLRRLIPSMGTWYSLIAAIMPVMVTLATQAMGLAAALGAVATAGAAIIGLGLIGHGEGMADSFAQAQRQLQDLKEDLFNVFQPVAQQFAPIQEDLFDWAPDQLTGVADAMSGLTDYEGVIYDIFTLAADGAERFFEAIAAKEQVVSQLATRFLQLTMTGLGDFLSFVLREAYNNQQVLIELAREFKNIMTIIYNVSKAFSRIVVALSPVISSLTWLSDLLNNRLVLAVVTFTTITAALTVALSKLGATALFALSRLGLIGSGSFVSAVVGGLAAIHGQVAGLIASYTALSGAAASAAAAMAMTGIGALAVGAGAAAFTGVMASDPGAQGSGYPGTGEYGRPGTPSSGDTTIYNDNRQYTINSEGSNDDYATRKQLESTIENVNGTEQAQQTPAPGNQ